MHGPPHRAFFLAAALLALGCCTAAPGPRLSSVQVREIDGRGHDLRVLSGQVALLYLMTTGCNVCLAELPKLRELHRRHHAQGLRVVLVALDPGGAKLVEPFAAALELPFPTVLAGAGLRSGKTALGPIAHVPRVVLLDRRGRVRFDRAAVVPFDELTRVVEATLQSSDGRGVHR